MTRIQPHLTPQTNHINHPSNTSIIESPVVFFTVTILEWKKLLKPEKYKNILTQSLAYLTKEGRVKVYAFVIMDNHIHLIWQALPLNTSEQLQRSFLRYTAQQIKFDLQKHHSNVLELFYVGAKDRSYQFWKRNSLSVELYNREITSTKSCQGEFMYLA